jgi:thioredoxin reductase (NADPH)
LLLQVFIIEAVGKGGGISMEIRNLIIIGSGPAGLTAAIYSGRAGLRPLVVEGPLSGGQITTAAEVENFPGFEEGIPGSELVARMRRQAERFGAEFLFGSVTSVNFFEEPFEVTVEGEERHRAHSVIIATGASPKLLGLESERRLLGRGVSTCAFCDGFFFKGKKVVVVGGGDSAIGDALYLSKIASHVSVVHRRDKLRASKILQDRAFSDERISFIWNSVVEEIYDPEVGKVTGLRLRDVRTGEVVDIECDGVFLAIGHLPNTALFHGQLEMDEQGYIITRDGTKTSREGVFAAGDVQDKRYRQAITAAGSGCMAAIDAERYLVEKGIIA